MNRIYFYKLFAAVLICFSTITSSAQTTTPEKKVRNWAFYAGVGPNFYFNNLVLGKNKVNEFNFSAVGRIMWEPEHFLSLGFESGYYRLYTLNSPLYIYSGDIHIVNSSIPLQFIVSMKFLKNFYSSLSFGRAILLNKVNTTDNGAFNASSVSLGDYTLSVGYKHSINDRFTIGSEVKAYYSGKLEDKNIALVFMGGIRF